MLPLLLTFWLAASDELPCHEVDFPTITTIEGCSSYETAASYSRCSFANAKLSKAANDIVRRAVRSRTNYDDAKEVNRPSRKCPRIEEGSVSASCHVVFWSEDLVSYECLTEYTGGRFSFEEEPWSILLDVHGAAVRELQFRDLFVSADAEKRFWTLSPELPDPERQFGFTLTDEGLTISAVRERLVEPTTIPYESLHGLLLPRFLPFGVR